MRRILQYAIEDELLEAGWNRLPPELNREQLIWGIYVYLLDYDSYELDNQYHLYYEGESDETWYHTLIELAIELWGPHAEFLRPQVKTGMLYLDVTYNALTHNYRLYLKEVN